MLNALGKLRITKIQRILVFDTLGLLDDRYSNLASILKLLNNFAKCLHTKNGDSSSSFTIGQFIFFQIKSNWEIYWLTVTTLDLDIYLMKVI